LEVIYQQALAAVEVVFNEWIETATELGRPIPDIRVAMERRSP
jgi:predicted RNase H-like HicB family nuclease